MNIHGFREGDDVTLVASDGWLLPGERGTICQVVDGGSFAICLVLFESILQRRLIRCDKLAPSALAGGGV